MSEGKKFKIAIVDDDASVCQATDRLLRAAGFLPITYLSGEVFLEDAKRTRPDCILLDIQLGGISGFEVQTLLVASGSIIPVIFITAHDDPETREQARRTNCVYLRKTDPGHVVIEAIRKAARFNEPKTGET